MFIQWTCNVLPGQMMRCRNVTLTKIVDDQPIEFDCINDSQTDQVGI